MRLLTWHGVTNSLGLAETENILNVKLNELYKNRDQLALKVIDYWKQHPEDVRKENMDLFQRLPKEEQALRERISHPQTYNMNTYTQFSDKAQPGIAGTKKGSGYAG